MATFDGSMTRNEGVQQLQELHRTVDFERTAILPAVSMFMSMRMGG